MIVISVDCDLIIIIMIITMIIVHAEDALHIWLADWLLLSLWNVRTGGDDDHVTLLNQSQTSFLLLLLSTCCKFEVSWHLDSDWSKHLWRPSISLLIRPSSQHSVCVFVGFHGDEEDDSQWVFSKWKGSGGGKTSVPEVNTNTECRLPSQGDDIISKGPKTCVQSSGRVCKTALCPPATF